MKKIILAGAFCMICFFCVSSLSYAEITDIGELMDNFQKATDLQKTQITKDNLGREILGSGKVSNAGEYDFFDITNDVKGAYYQVILEQQKTKNNTPYQLIFLFKDKDKVKDINKGQDFQKEGKIFRLEDERLQIAVWLFCGETTEKDKALLKQN